MALANGDLKSVFALKVGTVDYVGDIQSYNLTSEEADTDDVTFGEYNSGSARKWTLEVTAKFDGGSQGSLHAYLWANAGSNAAFEIAPHSGAVSTAKPVYKGTVRIPTRPDITQTATETAKFEFVFDVIGQPDKATTSA